MLDFILVDYDLKLIFNLLNLFFSDKFAKLFGVYKLEFFCFLINLCFDVEVLYLREIKATEVVEWVFLLSTEKVVKLGIFFNRYSSYGPVIDAIKQVDVHFTSQLLEKLLQCFVVGFIGKF